MRINQFVFDEREESGKFERVPTKKQYATGVNPYAETMRMEAVSRDSHPSRASAEADADQ